MRRPIGALLVVIAEAALALPVAGQDTGLLALRTRFYPS